ncbi:hypothetical protein EJB05_12748, partial [Eragrostis curvula]
MSRVSSLSPSLSGDEEVEEEEEDEGVDGYRKGGYHAVRPGDRFAAGRYVAQRKLGWGNFSTVWLAFDVQSEVGCACAYQQRNGRKSLTIVQGLKKGLSYNEIFKDLKKEFCRNGTVVQDPGLDEVYDASSMLLVSQFPLQTWIYRYFLEDIQLQVSQRKNLATFQVQVLSIFFFLEN